MANSAATVGIIVALMILATATVVGVATFTRRPLWGASAAVLGIATIVCAYLAVKDYLPIILVSLLGLGALAGGIALVGHIRRKA